jgi:hypothetical protein
LYAADHNPYEESYDVFPGNGGTVDTNGIAWAFLSKFSKESKTSSFELGQ